MRSSTLKIGDRVNKLVVKEILQERSRFGAIYIICTCSCGEEIKLRADTFRSGNFNNCPKCGIWSTFDSLSHFYSEYKNSSKDRKLEFKLTKEDVGNVINKNCHYCNKLPEERFIKKGKKIKKIIRNGIDRIDSSKGYIKGNILPCCYQCNIAKSNLSYLEFLLLIKSIYNNLELNK